MIYSERHGTAGTPVLLIQGAAVGGGGWEYQVRALAPRHRVVIFDNRGLGRSRLEKGDEVTIAAMAQDAKALITGIAPGPWHVVGHSMGGAVAQELALAEPGLVRSLALLCTTARGREAVRFDWPTLRHGILTQVGPLASRRRTALEMIYTIEYINKVGSEALAAETSRLFGRDLARLPPVAMRQVRALRAWDRSGELARLASIPTLVLSATKDLIVPAASGRRLAGLIPGARYVELADAGHGAIVENAEDVNRHLLGFIAGVDQRSAATGSIT